MRTSTTEAMTRRGAEPASSKPKKKAETTLVLPRKYKKETIHRVTQILFSEVREHEEMIDSKSVVRDRARLFADTIVLLNDIADQLDIPRAKARGRL